VTVTVLKFVVVVVVVVPLDGDIGPMASTEQAYMKQKHRLLWERRHGPVGTGMKTDTLH